jgi:FixJ family two-component response regulator
MIEAASQVPLISIVDDDASIRVAMVNLVRSLGFNARSFDSANQYLKSAERHETSCIVSDIQMPGISGLELQSNLAAQDDRTPIIFITAFPTPDIKKRALDAGAICFLTKPFDGQKLVNCIEVALKTRHESRGNA